MAPGAPVASRPPRLPGVPGMLWRAAVLWLAWSASWVTLAWGADAPERPARMALVIGNSAYAQAPLINPGHDARLMDEALRGLGFRTTVQLDAGRDAMLAALADFSRRLQAAGGDAVGLVFFAGHGVQIQGENYLVPVDARMRDAMDVRTRAVDASLVMRSLEEAGNRLNVVILDACRDNPFPSLGRSVSRGLARLEAPRGTLIAYSTAPGSVALDGDGRNSPYTAALVRAMKQPGLLIEQVFKQARIDVMRATRDQQIPWENSSLVGDFRFIEAAAGTTAAAVLPLLAQPSAPGVTMPPSAPGVTPPPSASVSGSVVQAQDHVDGRWAAADATGLVLVMRAGRYSSFQGSILVDAGLYEVSGGWIRSTSQYTGQVMAYRYTLGGDARALAGEQLTLRDAAGNVLAFSRSD